MPEAQYLAIARKWRPQAFDEVVGQEHITRTLTNAISSGRIHHAFLFIGSRGIGKTTTARILAKALNCTSAEKPTVTPCGVCDNCQSIIAGNNIDVIEIDGASNNTVDDVRDIRENVRMVPTSGRYKVYIIDEVHQLSTSAFNALLKTLEEPPAHAIFVLATTEAHKIPATIISRCQRYDFRRVAIKDLVKLLTAILEKEGVTASEDALHAIARVAEGGVRDAESILDELITYCDKNITFEDVFDVLGLVQWHAFHDMCDAMLTGNVVRQLEIIDEITMTGKDLSQFVEDLLRYYRNLLVCRTAGVNESLLRLPEAEMEAMRVRAERIPLVKLIKMIEQFSDLVNTFDSQIAQRTALEALLIRLSRVDVEVSLDTVMEKLLLLGLGGVVPTGALSAQTTPPAPPAPEPPPANPPEAGPRLTAPAVPASEQRIALGGVDMAAQWRAVVAMAGQESLHMGIWLGRAHPLGVDEDGIITLEFEPGADHAYAFFMDAANRDALNAFLTKVTTDVSGFKAVWKTPEPASVDSSKGNGASRRPNEDVAAGFAEYVQDPGVAAALDEFKGVIVDIRGGTSPGKTRS